MYAYVEDGEIVRFGQLPKVWQFSDGSTVSGFHLLDEATILAEGWYKVEKEDISYDEQTHYLANPTYEVLEDKVVARHTIESYPEPEPELPQPPSQEERLQALEEVMVILTLGGM